MPGQPHNVEEAIELERRAHETKLDLLNDPAFVAGLESAIEDEQAGRVIPFAEFKHELGLD